MNERLKVIDDQLASVGRRAAAEQRRIERDREQLQMYSAKPGSSAARGFQLAEQRRGR